MVDNVADDLAVFLGLGACCNPFRIALERRPLLLAIGKRFPGSVTGGTLDREALRQLVLGRPAELEALEAIVHPAVQAARTRFINDHRDASALLFDIPLLFETGGGDGFDKVITVSAPAEVQRERVLAREGMSAERLDAIYARTSGQPLFTEQLAAHLDGDEGLPELLADLLDRRLDGLSDAGWRVLRTLGVAERPLSPADLAAASGIPPEQLTSELHVLRSRTASAWPGWGAAG